MRPINTKVHGILDYIVGLIMASSPWILGFADGGPETWVPVALGGGAIVYSLFTNYELGVVKSIPMRTHLRIDLISGMFFLVSPWILNFADTVFWPHVVFGLLEIAVVLLSRKEPYGSSLKKTATT